MAEQSQGQGSGYDSSGSGSNAATLASRAGEGDFTVGGGLKVSSWTAGAILAALAIIAIGFLKKRKR